jgi:hypothetical protein
MNLQSAIRRRPNERGEGNTKFVITLVVFALVVYCIYLFLPVYLKEQQLRHDVKEKTRIGAINSYDPKRVEKDCIKLIDDLDFPGDIKVKVTKKGDNLFVACSGILPIKFIFYTYQYKIDFEEKFSRGGY